MQKASACAQIGKIPTGKPTVRADGEPFTGAGIDIEHLHVGKYARVIEDVYMHHLESTTHGQEQIDIGQLSGPLSEVPVEPGLNPRYKGV